MVKHIFPPRLFHSAKKSFSDQIKNRDDSIIASKTVFSSGNYINDVEIESRIEYFLYTSGKVLSKNYCGEHLYMISISKDDNNIFNLASV